MASDATQGKVESVGGVFLASHDVPRLAAWYKALGVPLGEGNYVALAGTGGVTTPDKGTILSIQQAGPGVQPNLGEVREEPYGMRRVTVNLRVTGIDGLVERMRRNGTPASGPKDFGYGKFAWLSDPDGNIVEVWEATGAAPEGSGA